MNESPSKTKTLLEETLDILETPTNRSARLPTCTTKIQEALRSLRREEHRVLNICHCYLVGKRTYDELLPGERTLVDMIDGITGPCPLCSENKE